VDVHDVTFKADHTVVETLGLPRILHLANVDETVPRSNRDALECFQADAKRK
jgi:hypothetical protein